MLTPFGALRSESTFLNQFFTLILNLSANFPGDLPFFRKWLLKRPRSHFQCSSSFWLTTLQTDKNLKQTYQGQMFVSIPYQTLKFGCGIIFWLKTVSQHSMPKDSILPNPFWKMLGGTRPYMVHTINTLHLSEWKVGTHDSRWTSHRRRSQMFPEHPSSYFFRSHLLISVSETRSQSIRKSRQAATGKWLII